MIEKGFPAQLREDVNAVFAHTDLRELLYAGESQWTYLCTG